MKHELNIFGTAKNEANKGLSRAKKYSKVLHWLLCEAYLKDFWKKPFWIFFFATVRLGCQALAVAVLYYYANALKDDRSLTFLTYNVSARDSIVLLWVIILLSFVLFALTSVFQYLSRVISISLGSTFEEKSSREILYTVSMLPDSRTPEANEFLKKGGIKKIFADARRTGMTIRRVGYSIPQMLSGIGATASTLFLDYSLTLMLGGLMGMVFLMQYPVNLKGARHSQTFEKEARRAGRALTKLSKLFLSGDSNGKNTERNVDALFLQGGYRSAIQAFRGRIKILEESTLVTEIGSALLISVAVFVIGSRLLNDNVNWGSLLAYIVSLRIALGGLVQVARLLANVSRFYPQLNRYRAFSTAKYKLSQKSGILQSGDTIFLKSTKNMNIEIKIDVPGRIALYTPDTIDRSLFHLFNFAVILDSKGNECPFSATMHIVRDVGSYAESSVKYRQHNAIESGCIYFIPDEVAASVNQDSLDKTFEKSIVITVYNDLAKQPEFDERLLLFWINSRLHGSEKLEHGASFDSISKQYKSQFEEHKSKVKQAYIDDEEDDDEI